jgi:calcineurin-like phosphoesterase family protein
MHIVAGSRAPASPARLVLAALAVVALAGCAHVGQLKFVSRTLTPADTTGGHHPERATIHTTELHGLIGPDTLIGFVPGTGDSARRYLGRLRDGYTADTLNIFLYGDNRPDYRSSRLAPELAVMRRGLSPNPVRIVTALVTIPWALVKGLVPDLGLLLDIPSAVRHMPTWGREKQVESAMLAKLDTLQAQHRKATVVINTGDLVHEGRRPAQWERFLRLVRPLATRVPYVAVAGNHEQTWTPEGLGNWRTATGLPIAGDRMYYCFDSADGWVRFIALDTNPITNPGVHWSKEVQIKYSNEEVNWLRARLKEHGGPAFVFMHSPPFSAGYHRMEWQDSVMQQRREQIVRAMHEGGISVLAAGHEHDYERALLTWPDGSVLVAIVQGGGGAPLHALPPPATAADLFAQYHVAGSTIAQKNVYTAVINNFTFMRLWFGGGELQTFAVDSRARAKLVDHVSIDLTRYGIPKIDQHKVPIAATAPVRVPSMEAKMRHGVAVKSDTTAASRRIETHPPPGRHRVRRRHPVPPPTTPTRNP